MKKDGYFDVMPLQDSFVLGHQVVEYVFFYLGNQAHVHNEVAQMTVYLLLSHRGQVPLNLQGVKSTE